MLAVADIATADTAQPPDAKTAAANTDFVDITFSAPKATPAVGQETAPSLSVNPQYANVDAAADTIGDLAIAKFRCDCNPCRVAVVQLLQTGQLSL
ncbi:MAG: hypothetical protein H7Z11_07245 [Verrucomicrobia bacterium]|nr:hypothetical protein [Leptolyngbya sp. ES-bin-22]